MWCAGDQYCKIEAERLSYLRENPKKLKVSDFTSFRDLLVDSGLDEVESNAVRGVRLSSLPSTFVGGARYTRKQMQDIIAKSSKVRHLDIFLTFRCSPNWPEIRQSLLPVQLSADRPKLYIRVLRIKLRAIMSFFIQEKPLGTVAAYVRVAEFQKLDPSHARCIFHLDEASKHEMRSPGNIQGLGKRTDFMSPYFSLMTHIKKTDSMFMIFGVEVLCNNVFSKIPHEIVQNKRFKI